MFLLVATTTDGLVEKPSRPLQNTSTAIRSFSSGTETLHCLSFRSNHLRHRRNLYCCCRCLDVHGYDRRRRRLLGSRRRCCHRSFHRCCYGCCYRCCCHPRYRCSCRRCCCHYCHASEQTTDVRGPRPSCSVSAGLTPSFLQGESEPTDISKGRPGNRCSHRSHLPPSVLDRDTNK